MKITSTLPLFYAAMLAGVFSIVVIVYLGWNESISFKRSQYAAMEKSSTGALNYVSDFVKQRNVLVRAFAENHADLLQQMVGNPEDEKLQSRVRNLIADYFPSHFTFVAREPGGEFVPDDLGEFVGTACRSDMSMFSETLELLRSSATTFEYDQTGYDPVIHPQPFNYHFDITAEWVSDFGEKGLLMISFPPKQLVRILKAHQITGHKLMLLRREPDDLIEVTANGWRENFDRDGRLNAEELNLLAFRVAVPATRWDIAYLPSVDVFKQQTMKVYRLGGITIVLILGLMAVFVWWYFVSETARRKVRQENAALLQQSNRDRTTLKTLIDLVPLPIFRNHRGRIVMINAAYAELLSMKVEDVQGKTLDEVFGAEMARNLLDIDAELLAEPGATKVYERHLKPVGQNSGRDVIVYKASMLPEGDLEASIIGAVVDVTEEKALRAKLEMLAMSDPLTGIANRRKFTETLKSELQRCARYDHPLSMIMLDIDRFKSVNDTYGHDSGDEVIKAVAKVLEGSIRQDVDLVGRVGGEEFAILLPETSKEDALFAAERIRGQVEAVTVAYKGHRLSITVSAGVASQLVGPGNLEPDQLFIQADQALYVSKNSGRNRVTVYEAA